MAFEVHGWPDRMCHMPSRRGRFHGLMNVKRNWQLRAASINVLQAALCRMVAVNFVPNSCSLTTHLDRSRIPLASSSSSRAVACTEAEILTRSVRTYVHVCVCVCVCDKYLSVSVRVKVSPTGGWRESLPKPWSELANRLASVHFLGKNTYKSFPPPSFLYWILQSISWPATATHGCPAVFGGISGNLWMLLHNAMQHEGQGKCKFLLNCLEKIRCTLCFRN